MGANFLDLQYHIKTQHVFFKVKFFKTFLYQQMIETLTLSMLSLERLFKYTHKF